MANVSRNLTVLMHMQVYCRQIVETLKRFNNSYENFLNDNDFQDSISMKVFQIGELVLTNEVQRLLLLEKNDQDGEK